MLSWNLYHREMKSIRKIWKEKSSSEVFHLWIFWCNLFKLVRLNETFKRWNHLRWFLLQTTSWAVSRLILTDFLAEIAACMGLVSSFSTSVLVTDLLYSFTNTCKMLALLYKQFSVQVDNKFFSLFFLPKTYWRITDKLKTCVFEVYYIYTEMATIIKLVKMLIASHNSLGFGFVGRSTISASFKCTINTSLNTGFPNHIHLP